MSKISTLNIQKNLVTLGQSLGFKAEMEYSFIRQHAYNPRYDVVWFLNVESLKIAHLKGIDLVEGKWLPLATFEIEGSTTSSKNQVGNVGNLFISPSQFHFIVVANKEAAKENDTYRRGVKIVRTMQELMGNKRIMFLDATMLPQEPMSETFIISNFNSTLRKKGSGGETISLPIADKLSNLLASTYLEIHYDSVSEYFKQQFATKKLELKNKQFTVDPETFERKNITSVSHYYYCPKVDISAGFQLAGGFIEFLKVISKNLKEDVELYPLLQAIQSPKVHELYYPLLGIEIETGDSKHAIGGLVNAGRLHQIGWLIGTNTIAGAVETYQHYLGLKNTYYIPFSTL